MPAPDLETLLDFETQVEDATLEFLRADLDLPSGQIYRAGDQVDLLTARVEVMFEVGEAQDPPVQRSSADPTLTYREYVGNLQVRVVTDAAENNTIALHRKLRAQTRAALLINATNFDSENLAYLDIKYMRPSGTTRETDEDFFVSEMGWDIRFAIRNDAWPSS